MKSFGNNNGKGFFITFPSGLCLSTQFGSSHYCENYGAPFEQMSNKINWESNDAEIAIIGPNMQFMTREFEDNGDDVLPRVSLDKWLKALDFCRRWNKATGAKKVVRKKHARG